MIGVVVFLIFISVVLKVASISFAAAVIIILAGFVVVLWHDAHESKKEYKKVRFTLGWVKRILNDRIFYRGQNPALEDYEAIREAFHLARNELKRQDGHY